METAATAYGTLSARARAFVLDLAIFPFYHLLMCAGIALVLSFFRGISGRPSVDMNEYGMMLKLFVPITWLLYWIHGVVSLGATPGKLLLGFHVVGSDLRHIGYGRALVRMLGYAVSLLPVGLGFLWIYFDGRRQGWHDKLAGTYVVRREFVKQSRKLHEEGRLASS